MQLQRMGWVIGLALVVGSIIATFLPESEEAVEERLFAEITYQMSELKVVTDALVLELNRLQGTQRQPIEQGLNRAADWLVTFRPEGNDHASRKAYLMQQRDAATALVADLEGLRARVQGSPPTQ
ncbi:MAG: hypothetical protein EBS77_03440 [Gammaproteobacteria bacterium]|nr:hypothetical protein [Gammaproteobacteria bacterium]